MLKIISGTENIDQVESLFKNSELFRGFDYAKVDGEIHITGMKYCTVIKQGNKYLYISAGPDKELKEFVEDIIETAPTIIISGSLQMGDDNYRKYYWFSYDPDSKDIKTEYAIEIDEFNNLIDEDDLGEPISSAWYSAEYYTDYGTEFVYFKTINDFRDSVERAISECELDWESKNLGLEIMDIYGLFDNIFDNSARELYGFKTIANDIKKKYKKDASKNNIDIEDDISNLVLNHLVSLSTPIDQKSLCEIWASAVKKVLSKSKFFRLFKIENDLEELETDDYFALLSEIAESYEGFAEMECDDIIEVCENFGLDTDIDEDDFSEAIEKMESMNIPSLEEYL